VKSVISFLLLCFVLAFSRCKDPYYPPVNNKPLNYLVVEGYIASDTVTVIRLTRTRKISKDDTAQKVAETNANVFVEDDHGNAYPLSESSAGTYEMPARILNFSYKYRLNITLGNGKNYLSDFVPFEQSPVINGIDWTFKNSGLQVYINTVGRQNESPYYRWVIEGTWEYHTPFVSGLQYDPMSGAVNPRTNDVHICWVSDNSTNVILGSTASAKNNVLHGQLIFFPNHDRRLSVKYSAFVTQYLLDSSAYNFWKAMKSNTEDIGSIFDSQPNQAPGNIHCTTDSTETVVGYIGAGNTAQFRGFIDNSVLPPTWNLSTGCITTFVPGDSAQYYFPYGYVPLYEEYVNRKKGWSSTLTECGDCTYLGTNVKPSFWP